MATFSELHIIPTGSVSTVPDVASLPVPANAGDIRYSVADDTIYQYSGSAWLTITGTTGITSLTDDVTASGTGSVAATVALVGGSTAAHVHTAELLANAATNANTASTIVKRDASGNFTAGTITAALTGNADTATTATSFSGSLVGDVTGTQGATVVAKVGTSTAANVHAAELLANAATNANTASTIVKRGASGGFSAGYVTVSQLATTGTVVSTATDAGSLTIANTTINQILAPDAATVATFTLTFPAAPFDGQLLNIANGTDTNTITALTVSGNGNTIIGALTGLSADTFSSYVFNTATTTWFRIG